MYIMELNADPGYWKLGTRYYVDSLYAYWYTCAYSYMYNIDHVPIKCKYMETMPVLYRIIFILFLPL